MKFENIKKEKPELNKPYELKVEYWRHKQLHSTDIIIDKLDYNNITNKYFPINNESDEHYINVTHFREIKNKLKPYMWSPEEDSEYNYAVIAESHKEAKKLGANYYGKEVGHDSPDWFIEQRCHLIKRNVNIEGLSKGVIDDGLDGLKRGFYSWIDYETCPKCKTDDTTVYYEDGYYCNHCEESESEEL